MAPFCYTFLMEKLTQLIPGNPGTSYVTCLMFALSKKYNIEIANDKQIEIFCNGISVSRKTFFAKTIDLISNEYDKHIYGFTDNMYLLNLAKDESDNLLVSYRTFSLNEVTLNELIERYGYVILSADIFYFNNSYHDYHFCCIGKHKGKYSLFEPKSGTEKEVSNQEIKRLIQSISKNLSDAVLAFCI